MSRFPEIKPPLTPEQAKMAKVERPVSWPDPPPRRTAEDCDRMIQFVRDGFSGKPITQEKPVGFYQSGPPMFKKIICFLLGHSPKLFRSGNIRCLRCWKKLESVKKD